MTDETYNIEINKFFEAHENSGLKYPVEFNPLDIEIPIIDFNISEYKQKEEIKIFEYKKSNNNSIW